MDIKKLEADFEMYEGAVKDLKENDGDPEAIQELMDKKARVGQVLNMVAGLCVRGGKSRLGFV